MPRAAPRPCTYPGCTAFAEIGARCKPHEVQIRKQVDERRGSSTQRGYGGAWQKARVAYLHAHPLCRACEQAGLVVAASVVDHIVAHKGDKARFWDSSNWQPLCKPCHDRKTATEDGGGTYGWRGA